MQARWLPGPSTRWTIEKRMDEREARTIARSMSESATFWEDAAATARTRCGRLFSRVMLRYSRGGVAHFSDIAAKAAAREKNKP